MTSSSRGEGPGGQKGPEKVKGWKEEKDNVSALRQWGPRWPCTPQRLRALWQPGLLSTCFSTEPLNKRLPAGNKGVFHVSLHNQKQIQVMTHWTNRDQRSRSADLRPSGQTDVPFSLEDAQVLFFFKQSVRLGRCCQGLFNKIYPPFMATVAEKAVNISWDWGISLNINR